MSTDLDKRRIMEQSFEAISPFEFKNELIRLARENEKKSARAMLNAGRGNPNWIAATPRQAFFALGQFAVEESCRVWKQGDLAGKPAEPDVYKRLQAWLAHHEDEPGVRMLGRLVDYGVRVKNFDPDAWVHELVDGIIGDNYPMPDRMLVHVEEVVHDYLIQELCEGDETSGPFKLFATEGATAAMCYIFDSLVENYLLKKGDRIAIMVPIFPPYVEIPHLWKYDFDVVQIGASAVDAQGYHTWQYPDEELDKLRDPSIQALFLVNPSNPPSVMIEKSSMQRIEDIIRRDNPNLMVITDDVYSTFVDGFRSLLADVPSNTVGVYSFSKYFGVTGWRLGVIALREDNVFDKRIAELPTDKKEILNGRYASMSKHPADLTFMDRLVADSRQVALNHTAGLSTPQQVQMALFCLFALTDKDNQYKRLTQDICQRRMKLLYQSLELPLPRLPHDADYYTQFDLGIWATHHYGEDFARYLKEHYEPVDILFRLAEESSIVLLPGAGFYGPDWSLRVSLANLNDEDYATIGQSLHRALDDYVDDWRAGQK